jgi:hypothetical protein
VQRLQRWVLGALCWLSRQRSKLESGSTDGGLAEADGSTDGVVDAAGGSTDGVVVLAEVRGSIGGEWFSGSICVSEEKYPIIKILPSALAETQGDEPFVAIVRSREELCRWLRRPLPGLGWLQVEGLLGDSDAWIEAAHSGSDLSLDLILADASSEFPELYKLVDVSAVHDVRVTIQARPGLLKAVKLAAALRFPIRILPGQPKADVLAELKEALDFYLHDPAVEAPIEFFHSWIAATRGTEVGSLWMILEEDPAAYLQYDMDGQTKFPPSGPAGSSEKLPAEFVENHLKGLLEQGTECATCPWQQSCRGYFKWPDRAYSCQGIKDLFSIIQAAADEMARDLASCVLQSTSPA